jgi:uncharacterized protein (DUF362 family)
MNKIPRRAFLPLAGAGAVASYLALNSVNRQDAPVRQGRREKSPVSIVKAKSYDDGLTDKIARGVKELGLHVKGKRILLKPNVVEFEKETCINTDPRVVLAAMEVFESMGAAEVIIGEGPGHRRDTIDLVDEASYRSTIPDFERRFVDLNRDNVSLIKNFVGNNDLYFPESVLAADLVVSVAKMKTHHWAGATLSMKNFFGVVPGSVYGWPKNQLHYFGLNTSILALHRQLGQKSFAIVDGVIGMEGNGPVQGTPKNAGVIVLGKDMVSVDATCCRIMGIDPEKIGYLAESKEGNRAEEDVEQRGERISSVSTEFELMEAFASLRKKYEG